MDAENEQNTPLEHQHTSLNAWLNTDTSEHNPLDTATRCEKCQEDLEGPCYEHTDVKRIIFDKPPIPLAYSSLPDALGIINIHPTKKEEMIFAKQKIQASTLFGPLIAPLAPLDELKGGPPRYTLWSEETQELQAYDLTDDFLCNWIKFIRPTRSLEEANVIAYQQRGSIYLVAVRDILPSTEMRVYLKMPRSSSLPNHQLSLFVQSLLNSYSRQKSEEIQTVDEESEINEAPTPKRKRSKRTSSQRTKKVKATAEEPSISVETEHDMEGLSEVASVDENPREERQLEIANTTGMVIRKRTTKAWRLLHARYKSGEMTEDEKRLFENDERTLQWKKERDAKKKADRVKENLKYANKVAQMTKEEREACLAKKRANNAKNAHKNNKLQKLVRERSVQGIPLTPEEQLKWDDYTARRSEYLARKRREKRIAQGKDPDAPKLTTGGGRGRALPGSTFRQKLRQGLPLTPEEKLRHEQVLALRREQCRRSYTKVKIAHGLEPKVVISRRKPPFRGKLTEHEKPGGGESSE